MFVIIGIANLVMVSNVTISSFYDMDKNLNIIFTIIITMITIGISIYFNMIMIVIITIIITISIISIISNIFTLSNMISFNTNCNI